MIITPRSNPVKQKVHLSAPGLLMEPRLVKLGVQNRGEVNMTVVLFIVVQGGDIFTLNRTLKSQRIVVHRVGHT
jgi:hypothetical protein